MQKIDILYIIRDTPSENDDLELKYSLRSLERYVIDFGNIYITGRCPEFINEDKIIYTYAKDIGTPMTNHWWKVLATVKNTNISEDFALMYDDIFFTSIVKMMEYPAYKRGLLGESHTGSTAYRMCLEETKQWLLGNKLPIIDFELHVPFIYNREEFIKMGNPEGRAVRSTYGNMFFPRPEWCQQRTDVKIRATDESPNDLPSKYDCFSVSEKAFKYNVQPWCESHFQTKSRWEK